MPHSRFRHILPFLQKKLTFSPVIAIQGARQTGKSFLVRDLLAGKQKKLVYKTFDQKNEREFADTNPETFLEQCAHARPFAIDEAQKVPHIFDAIKFVVDQKRIPGSYILLGSTEFSKLTLIREPLTGRMAKIRLFPLNIREVFEKKIEKNRSPLLICSKPELKRPELLQYLNRGGFPGIFATRSNEERESLLRDWLELTVSRDAMMIPKLKLDSDLLMRILECIAQCEEPTCASISKILKKDPRRIATHIKALETLFVIHSLLPHPLGTGKACYFVCDVALAKLLGASFERQLYTWMILEQLSQRSYSDDRSTKLFYYRSSKGSIIHLVAEKNASLSALKIFAEEKVALRDLNILTAFAEKAAKKNFKTQLCGLASSRQSHKSLGIELFPWESMG